MAAKKAILSKDYEEVISCPKRVCSILLGKHWRALANSNDENATQFLMNLSKYELLMGSLGAMLAFTLTVIAVFAPLPRFKAVRNKLIILLVIAIIFSFLTALLGFTLHGFLVFVTRENIKKFVKKFGYFIDIPLISFSISIILMISATFVYMPEAIKKDWRSSNILVNFVVILLTIFIVSYLVLLAKLLKNLYQDIDKFIQNDNCDDINRGMNGSKSTVLMDAKLKKHTI